MFTVAQLGLLEYTYRSIQYDTYRYGTKICMDNQFIV